MKLRHLIFCIILFSLSSCSALKEAEKEIERQQVLIEELEKQKEYTPERQSSSADLDAVKHIVFFKLSDGEDRKTYKTFYYLLKELEGIEYVNNFELSETLKEEYSGHVKSDYDLVMFMTFASEDHLAKYQKHEIHLKVQEMSVEYVSNVWSYDFKSVQ